MILKEAEVLTDEGFAAMLLTMALSPNREEYARPLSTQEYYRLAERVRDSKYRTPGGLIGADISGMMMYIGISEEEAYRIYTLLNRAVQFSYALEEFAEHRTEIVPICDESYPERLRRRMPQAAPPFLYRAGNARLIGAPAVAILGISGVKTTPEVREGVISLVKSAVRANYTVITGGELGVARVAAGAVLEHGGTLVDVLGGGLYEHMEYEPIAQLLSEQRAALVSLEHPEAMFTVSHAIARNKVAFALADAAFICNTDNKRGELDALHNHYCDWIYALSGAACNQPLISHGATPVADLRGFDFAGMCRHWQSSQSEQMSMFDLL